jgi:uncharacterized protein
VLLSYFVKKEFEYGGDSLIPTSFIHYLYHFHVDRDYFECHEILEEFWKQETEQQKNSIWVGFILLAVANYHHRRSNFSGATRTLEKAIAIFISEKEYLSKLGFKEEELFDLLHRHKIRLNNQIQYESYTLPISLSNIELSRCFTQREISQMNWGQKSDLCNEGLIHRHKLRDRKVVIEERQNALIRRKHLETD